LYSFCEEEVEDEFAFEAEIIEEYEILDFVVIFIDSGLVETYFQVKPARVTSNISQICPILF